MRYIVDDGQVEFQLGANLVLAAHDARFISENNFIQGAIDIIALSLERARRTGAVTTYEQSRVALHNSIVLLEMLTNVKVITDK